MKMKMWIKNEINKRYSNKKKTKRNGDCNSEKSELV